MSETQTPEQQADPLAHFESVLSKYATNAGGVPGVSYASAPTALAYQASRRDPDTGEISGGGKADQRDSDEFRRDVTYVMLGLFDEIKKSRRRGLALDKIIARIARIEERTNRLWTLQDAVKELNASSSAQQRLISMLCVVVGAQCALICGVLSL